MPTGEPRGSRPVGQLTDGPLRVGTRYETLYRFFGRSERVIVEITELVVGPMRAGVPFRHHHVVEAHRSESHVTETTHTTETEVSSDLTPEPAGAAEPPAPPAAPPTPPKRSNLRLFLIIGALAVFLVFVLYETRNNQSANDLVVGSCFDEPTQSTDISTVTRHECTEPHDAEVIAVAEDSATSYPTTSDIEAFVDSTCVPVFQSYVGEDDQSNLDLTISYFYPNSDGWDSGDRTVTCYVTRDDATKLTQSIKGSASPT